MILGEDKARLSKRHGATSVQEYRDAGYLPDAMINYLALLGWSLDGSTEIFTREQLVEKFSLKRVSKNPAAFDQKKLDHINAEHFKMLDPLQKVSLVYRNLVSEGILPADFAPAEYHPGSNGNGGVSLNGEVDPAHQDAIPRIGFIVNVLGNRLTGVDDAVKLRYFFKDDYDRDAESVRRHLSGPAAADRLVRLADAIEAVTPFTHDAIEAAVRGLAEELGIKAGELIHPCRVALTGQAVSPDIFSVVQLLGKEKSVERLRAAIPA
jgi:glutamyl-tRNA synthetase